MKAKQGIDNIFFSPEFLSEGKNGMIYELVLNADEFESCKVVKDLDEFCGASDVIVANRIDEELARKINSDSSLAHKIYTRDLWGRD